MLDSKDLLISIKKAASEAVEAGQPSDFCFGKVTGVKPLKILVEQKLVLSSAQLVLTRNVTDYTVNLSVNHKTDNALDESLSHSHSYSGSKPFTIHNALLVGEEVVLLKQKGGQRYLVLDRVVNA